MPLVQKGILAFSDRIPKVISPTAHAVADYATLGGFILMGALLWKRNRRAAIASLACAGAEAANTLLTDFPGGVAASISFQTHGRIDACLAAAAGSLPNFLAFAEAPEARFFRLMGLNITLVHALTDFGSSQLRPHLRKSA